MTQNLILYWQRLRRRPVDDTTSNAPVLDLAGCFAKSVIAAQYAAETAPSLGDQTAIRVVGQ